MSGVSAAGLLAWYHTVARDLPWRRTQDPYRILVSEVMLQQTQVARVIPYYEAFLVRFPDAAVLAQAPVADVLAAWSGLGYNRRALALQRAAATVTRDGWPTGAAGLRALPGVGPYTAAAVASICFGEPIAVVDTNVRRVVHRLDGRTYPPAELQARTQALLDEATGGDPALAATFNQATMELGATVCAVRQPACERCPLAAGCRSRGRAVAAPGTAAARTSTRLRFEDSDRWVRGRVVAALVAGGALPDVESARLERVIAGLRRDGLVEVDAGGAVRLP